MNFWHFAHLFVRILEALVGLFCLVTSILLYPDQEGRIQSQFEQLWVRADDYQKLALSRHAAFMTQVAQLEARFLDNIFGQKLISGQALAFSFCCSFVNLYIAALWGAKWSDWPRAIEVFFGMLVPSLIIGGAYTFFRKDRVARRFIVIGALVFMTVFVAGYFSDPLADMGPWFSIIVLSGFACDVAFVALTRRLLRWAGGMNSTLPVASMAVLDLLLALILISPLIMVAERRIPLETIGDELGMLCSVAITNLFDVTLSCFFFFLLSLLLIHRAIWPILTRTLFRMQDIGTKGRRAILAATGISLLGMSLFGEKPPDSLKDLLKSLTG